MIDRETPLIVKRFGVLVPACPTGRHCDHPGMDCEGADEQIATEQAALECLFRALERTAMTDVPPALRGPRWKEATP